MPTPPVLTGRRDFGKTESVSRFLDNRRLSPVACILPCLRNIPGLPSESRAVTRRRIATAFWKWPRWHSPGQVQMLAGRYRQTGRAGNLIPPFPDARCPDRGRYHTEVEKLAAAQRELSANLPPIEALRAWMVLFVDYIATKQIIPSALNSVVGGPSKLDDSSRVQVSGAVEALMKTAIRSGEHTQRPRAIRPASRYCARGPRTCSNEFPVRFTGTSDGRFC
jgi:hypothetical protein